MPAGALTMPRKMISVTSRQRLPPWQAVLKPSRTAVIGLMNGSRLLEAACAPVPCAGAAAASAAGFAGALALATAGFATGFAAGFGAAAFAAGLAAAFTLAGLAFAAGLLTAAFGAAGLAGEVTLFLAAAFAGVAAVAGLAELFFAVFGAAAGLLAVLCPKASDAASSIAMVLIARFIMLSVPLLYFLAAAAAAGCNVPES